MVGGGLLWGFDVGGLEDLRRRVGARGRGSGGKDGDEDVEVEFERWVASFTGGGSGGGGGGEREDKRKWSAREPEKK